MEEKRSITPGNPASALARSVVLTVIVGLLMSGSLMAAAPRITSITPTSVTMGTTVTITGINFTGATAVAFRGVAATSFTVVGPTTITAVVPRTATGRVTVTTPEGTATSPQVYTYFPPPRITSLTPLTVAAGTVVTITGTGFTGATSVKFSTVAATSFTVVSATRITAVVPRTRTGRITVTTPGGTATSPQIFTFIPAPRIASFTPSAAKPGSTVTIAGTDFTGATAVRFNGIAAASFRVVSATSITAVVPTANTGTGRITVTTPGGTGTSLTLFTFIPTPPTITSFAPSSGGPGTVVTINGTYFTGASSVKFAGVAATSFSVVSATRITAVVPMTVTGRITVTTPSGTATSATSFTFAATLAGLLAQGKSKLNQLVMMEPYNPTTAKALLASAYSFFLQARSLSTTNADANFGLALTDAAKTAQAMVDKYEPYYAVGNAQVANLRAAVTAFQFLGGPEAIVGDSSVVSRLTSTYTQSLSRTPASTAEADLAISVQADVKNTIMPMLSRVAGYLNTVETTGGASYTFPIGTSTWDGYVLADMGDIYCFHGALLAARWALAIPASYNLSPGAYSFDRTAVQLDTNRDGLLSPGEYLPLSPFGALTSAATMTAAKADMTTGCAKIIAGLNATLAETADNHELLPWHTPGSGITRNDLLAAKEFVSKVQSSMNAPTLITYTGSDEPFSMNVFLGAWNVTPPSDLKLLCPTMEIVRRREATRYVYEMQPAENGWPDRTCGGIYPDGVPGLTEAAKVTVDTAYNGTLAGLSTYPANGATNVSTAAWPRPTITFGVMPPATFSVRLQRYFAGAWRGEYLCDGWMDGYTYYVSPGWDLWPNSSYRMLITDEIHQQTLVRTFTTGADQPF